MILSLDVGNSQIFGGVFDGEELKLRFRHSTLTTSSSDQFGLFLRSVLRENDVNPDNISQIAICSVVPALLYSLRSACIKYFDITPFTLGPGVKTGLKIAYKNPTEVGADRIANAIAARHLYPDENVIIVDFGTATTFCTVTKDKTYQGGVIIAGLNVSMKALEERTAKLPSVEIVRPESVLGRTTVSSIQSGLYYAHLFAVKGIIQKIAEENLEGEAPVVIGTGGFANLFENEHVFKTIEPNLVLQGLNLALRINQ
ncbi:MAG: pantothenate kinase [Halobacteriovoraceae bacterium]|nr:pantothenate kinase [Halobacteriovoraceae bacterium]|tara:strand:+ start:12834 stop:13604 length:771 start_codon:yes stop_codon:yes gene_type:complete